jgi:hypothetical protein
MCGSFIGFRWEGIRNLKNRKHGNPSLRPRCANRLLNQVRRHSLRILDCPYNIFILVDAFRRRQSATPTSLTITTTITTIQSTRTPSLQQHSGRCSVRTGTGYECKTDGEDTVCY